MESEGVPVNEIADESLPEEDELSETTAETPDTDVVEAETPDTTEPSDVEAPEDETPDVEAPEDETPEPAQPRVLNIPEVVQTSLDLPEVEPDVSEPVAADEPITAEEPPEPEEAAKTRSKIPWWPFIVYVVLWIAFVGASVYLLGYMGTGDVPAYRDAMYPLVVLGGLALALIGPLLSIVTWIVVRARTPRDERGGLFVSAALRGSAFTLLGVAAWFGGLYAIDAMRLGLF